jgi:hypothetical protein
MTKFATIVMKNNNDSTTLSFEDNDDNPTKA